MVVDWQIHRQGTVWFEERIDELLEQIVKICEIEAPTFAEQTRAQYVAAVMQQLPRGTTTIDDCGNVVYVFREPEAGQGFLLVTAHLDTAFPAARTCAFGARESVGMHPASVTTQHPWL